MNKVMMIALLVGGLFLIDVPEAAAHKAVYNVHYQPAYRYTEVRRAKHMPYWLKRDKSFRHWYRQSTLRRDLRLSWRQLFEIYHWERRFGRTYYRSDDYWNDYYSDRHRRDDRRRDRHRH